MINTQSNVIKINLPSKAPQIILHEGDIVYIAAEPHNPPPPVISGLLVGIIYVQDKKMEMYEIKVLDPRSSFNRKIIYAKQEHCFADYESALECYKSLRKDK